LFEEGWRLEHRNLGFNLCDHGLYAELVIDVVYWLLIFYAKLGCMIWDSACREWELAL
jgi:hypothetical protein